MNQKSVLDMSNKEAQDFFFKPTSYSNIKLPPYFSVENLLENAKNILGRSELKSIIYTKKVLKSFAKEKNFSCEKYKEINNIEYLEESTDVNLTIVTNKDAKYAWRSLQLIHPILYVDLVRLITKEENWDELKSRFRDFQSDEKIICMSVPLESTGKKQDQAEQILNWWKNLEQAQIELALDYNYCLQTDITDCYPSIYTHTIPWAIHDKEWAKENRSKGLGNTIDSKIRQMQNGQTNGIPQGSALMDFIAEIVLGYADILLSKKATECGITGFKVLRYRDDYRIFTNQLDVAERLMKLLSEILLELNLKINSKKTFLCKDIIVDAIKPDKLYWTSQNVGFYNKITKINFETARESHIREYKLSMQKHLLQIKLLGDKFPNCGQLKKALTEFFKYRISTLDSQVNQLSDIPQLISIIVSIMINNPKTIEISATILAKLFEYVAPEEISALIDRILKKYQSLPKSDFVEIWLQRISLTVDRTKDYKNRMCKKVSDKNSVKLWNSNWLKSDKRLDENCFIDEEKIESLTLNTDITDIDSFMDIYGE